MHLPRRTPAIRHPACAIASSELETFHLAIRAPFANDLVEFDRSAAVLFSEQAGIFRRLPFIVVVPRGAFPQESLIVYGLAPDRCDPFGLGLRRGFERSRFLGLGMLNQFGDVARLLLEHVREVLREAVLRNSHVEAIREPRAVETMQRLEAVRPVLGEGLTSAAVDLETCATGVGGANLEAGAENDAIHLVLDALEDQAFLGDAIDAAALRIDERYVGPVERWQILVVEGRSLAELPIPWLQRLGSFLVLDDPIHARAHLVHLLEVGQFNHPPALARRQIGIEFGRQQAADLAEDVGPSVADEILVLTAA